MNQQRFAIVILWVASMVLSLMMLMAAKDPNAILHQGASDVGSPPTGYPMYIAGIDGTNLRGILTDTGGRVATLNAPGAAGLAGSSSGGAQANNVTLAGVANKTTYITGFSITGLGATSASAQTVTITGTANTLTYILPIPAGTTTSITPIHVTFPTPIPASAANTAITVNVPSFGAGNTTAAAVATGFQL
jgi:hypothetical protein